MLPTSHVAIPSQSLAWPAEMQPFKDHASTHGHQTGLRNQPG